MAGTAAAVVDFPVSFDTEGEAQVAYISHFMTKGIVDESPVGKRMEFAIGMFTAEADDIGFADEWFPAGQQIEMTAQFLALGHDFIHHIEGQIQRMAVFGSPASDTMHIAGTGRIKKNSPGDITVIFRFCGITGTEPIKTGFKSQIHDSRFDNIRVERVQRMVQKMEPFAIFVNQAAGFFKGFFFK